ncbi:MAG TPA: MarR family transcriptional regulator [Streptosporangiaceae bacterium]|jgi:DNA-binding MarR family transcriptional regulator|nr:MarR family transcriptional regulator [Streptosporangiaceae bacterium]
MTTGDSTTTDLNVEILDSMAELLAAMLTRAEEVAQRNGVPIFFLKALHRLDCPMAMKDLGMRMRCDPSFVTNVADQLEKRGLATRESDPADRRVKRIALTPAGLELKQRIENEILNGLPWRHALDNDERACLLGLVRKLLPAAQTGDPPGHETHHGAAEHREEVSEVLVSAPATGADG